MNGTCETLPETGEQLRLFLTAREVMARWQALDVDRWIYSDVEPEDDPDWEYCLSSDETYDQKLDEAYGSGLADSILDHGVKRPIGLSFQCGHEGRPMVAGGHHRLAVMAEHRPDDLIPVLYWESFGHAFRSREYHYT